jgi:hypothetical protein
MHQLCRLACVLGVTAVVTSAVAQSPTMTLRHDRINALRYVSNPCQAGQVRRNAFAGDRVCVAPARQAEVAQENELASARIQPGGGAYGPSTCINGYVWREARPGDLVCVTPAARLLASMESNPPAAGKPADNANALCPSPSVCERRAREKRQEAQKLRQKIENKQKWLAKVRDDERRAREKMAEDDRRYARENPGLGRSTQPSIADNVTPLKHDIDEMEKALREAEKEAASLEAAGKQAPRP